MENVLTVTLKKIQVQAEEERNLNNGMQEVVPAFLSPQIVDPFDSGTYDMSQGTRVEKKTIEMKLSLLNC